MTSAIDSAAPNQVRPEAVPAVCIVGPLPPPSGGMANQCEQLARLLRAEGVAVEVVRNNPDYRPQWVGRVPVLRAFARLLPYLFALWRAAGRAEVMHVLANSGWAWHLFAAPAVWIARLRGCPVIINYRGGNAGSFFSKAGGHVLATARLAALRVTPSRYLQRVFVQHGLDAEIVPNIIDLSRFRPRAQRDFGRAPHLIVTRNLEPIYDIPTAIRAFAKVRESFFGARLTVAGSGPERHRLQLLVAELGLEQCVKFAGRLDNSQIPELYASADCMLNASRVDNMPISILEALASEVPVVSTSAGGIPDLVEHELTALLVPIAEPELMASQVVRVLDDHELAERLRKAGSDLAHSFDWSVVRGYWFDAYRRASMNKK